RRFAGLALGRLDTLGFAWVRLGSLGTGFFSSIFSCACGRPRFWPGHLGEGRVGLGRATGSRPAQAGPRSAGNTSLATASYRLPPPGRKNFRHVFCVLADGCLRTATVWERGGGNARLGCCAQGRSRAAANGTRKGG